MSSRDEYRSTRRLPDTIVFENGPTFHLLPTVEIIDGAVLWSWRSESGNNKIVYRQPASENDRSGRSAVIFSTGALPPPHAAVQLAQFILPDNGAIAGIMQIDDLKPVMMLAELGGMPRFPGWN
jgi:hypothetical protein